MSFTINEKDFEKFIMVNDKVLVKPRSAEAKTASGLILPPTVEQKEKLGSGYVIKVGPGYPIPAITDDYDEPWKDKNDQVKYVPLQARPGDLAIYLQKSGWEVLINDETYIILPHSAIIMLIRDESLFTKIE